jgi:dihydroorotase
VVAASSSWLIAGGRVVDPSRRLDLAGDLLVVDGKVAGVVGRDCPAPEGSVERLDAAGLVVAPGFVDLHCHLRQPGHEHKETIRTGTRAAARGGFTTVCAMANTEPPIDSRGQVEYVQSVAAAEGIVRVLPIGAVTKGLRGQELAEMGDMADAGVVAFSDDGNPIKSSRLMRHALEYARLFGRPVMPHCDDPDLMAGGVMNDGPVAAMLGLRGIPAAGEKAIVARDVALAELTGGRLHVCHVSTAGAVEVLRAAKARGVRVTAEATPHHLTLTDGWVAGVRWEGRGQPYDTNTKMNPPLRSPRDRESLVAGLADGTLDAIATDHAPHASVDKLCEFDAAAFGITGLETALGALLRLVESGELDLTLAIEKLTIGPCRAFGLPYGTLAPGAPADVVVFDPKARWRVDPAQLASLGKNTPLVGQELVGRVLHTIVGGRLVAEAVAV